MVIPYYFLESSSYSKTMSIEFRVAKLEDKDRDDITSIQLYAYNEPPQAHEKFKNTYNLIYKEHYVGAINGEIVVSLRCVPLIQNVRGIFKKMGGVAMVATYAEERRKGYCRALMKYSYEKMKEDNILVSTLTPFKDSFYMQFGYVNAKPSQFMEFNPLWFSRWKTLPKGYIIKRMRISEGAKQLQDCQEYVVEQFNGGVKRYDDRWNEFMQDNSSWLVLVYNPKGKVEGAMYYRTAGYGDRVFGEDNIGRMGGIGFYPKTLEAKHALFHFIYLHSEQLVKVLLPLLPYEDNFQSWIQDHIKNDIKQHFISMVRIIKVDTVFDDIPVHQVDFEQYNEEISMEVQDPMCEWNNGILKLWEKDGVLQSKFYPNETLDAKITIEGLSALLYGTITVKEVEYFGWLTNIPDEDKDVLDLWFPRREYYCTEFF
jgi:predicted acetyltransferase